MNPKPVSNEIHCNSCGYEGRGKSNSTVTFLILAAMACSSVILLPMIIVALVYMVWILSKPVTYSCPQCKSKDVKSIEAGTARKSVEQTETKEILEDN